LVKAAHQEEKENYIKKNEEGNGKPPRFYARHDMDCAIVSKDNGIKEAISQELVELCLAGNGVRHSQSSSSKILTTRVWEKEFSSEMLEPCYKRGNWKM